jgi:Ca2+-binding EF-hand superfamily protein
MRGRAGQSPALIAASSKVERFLIQ